MSLWAAGGLTAALSVLLFCGHTPAWLSWFALAPLAGRLCFEKPRTAFFAGWFFGFLVYAGLGYWLIATLQRGHVLSALPVFGVLLLFTYLGVFWGLWFLLFSCLARRLRQRPFWLASVPLVMAMGWVSLEYLRTYLFSGLPWSLLADWLVDYPALIQVASVTGVYGVSFLIVWVNTTIAMIFIRPSRAWWGPGTLGGAVLLITCLWGRDRVRRASLETVSQPVTIAIVQPYWDTTEGWSAARTQRMQPLLAKIVAQAAQAPKPDVVLWPEGALPEYPFTRGHHAIDAWLERVVRTSGTNHLIGSPRWDGKRGHNSVFALTADFRQTGSYDKVHVCPFAEFTPLEAVLVRWFPILKIKNPCAPGTATALLSIGGISYGPMICFESIFPALARARVRQGGEVLVNISNDGWFGDTAALTQHFAANVWRAVENDRWLICVNNSGISAIINPRGVTVAQLPKFQNLVLRGIVYPRRTQTFYTRHGDLFAKGCMAVVVLLLLF